VGADRKPIGFYLSSAWIALCVFLTAFGDSLPITSYKTNDFDAMGVGPFSPNHILGISMTCYLEVDTVTYQREQSQLDGV